MGMRAHKAFVDDGIESSKRKHMAMDLKGIHGASPGHGGRQKTGLKRHCIKK